MAFCPRTFVINYITDNLIKPLSLKIKMLTSTQKLALETINLNKQALIFVPSRASAEKTAEEISKLTNHHFSDFEKEILKAASTPTKQCRRLSHCLKKGIAFHHAGLLQKQKDLIEEEFRKGKIKIICCTPTLCLSGDTFIWQPDGNTLVRNFKHSCLFALSQSNRLLVMKAKNVNKNKNSHKLIEITSVSGYSIKLTPNHQILVKREKKKELTTASECKKGDKIATVGKIVINETTKPKLSHFVRENNLTIQDRELTEDDFYFIGSMLGDGHSGAETRDKKIIYKGSPTFTSGDLESIELIELISKSFDQFSKRKKRFGAISLVLTKKKWFREFCCKCGIEIGKNKHMNSLLMQADLKLVKPLIQGLFDSDGYVQTRRNIGFSNISFELIRDLQKSLLRFGIVSRVRKRLGKRIHIIRKFYQTKDHYELLIDQQRSILLFSKLINFGLIRKQRALSKLVEKISHILYSECKTCKYKIYSNIFSGRTKEQKEWGTKKKKVIKLLGEKYELGSKEIKKRLGFLPRHSKGNRLNHHYELISKKRIGSKSNTEWLWKLNPIGSWAYWKIIKQNKEISKFFKLNECPLCKNKLHKKLRKKWRDSDFEGDIFWDYVRNVKEVDVEENVYDIVLPNKPKNNHLFVANGFIVHNSAGMSLPAFRVIIKSLKRYSGKWGMNWIPVLEYMQMAGRAGRPEYESYGEAISIAKNEKDKENIYNTYLLGNPEEIYSKLAAEPVLRTYLLSLISSGIIIDDKTMKEFFSKTFWAQQYNDKTELENIMQRMLSLLSEWKFVTISDKGVDERTNKEIKEEINNGNNKKDNKNKYNSNNEKENDFYDDFSTAKELITDDKKEKELKPTLIGKRISELYLDPLTAKHLLDSLNNFTDDKTVFSLLQMISHTLEMRPLLRIKSKEQDQIQGQLVEKYNQLLEEEPNFFDLEYPEFMNSIKTALFFEAWINEKDEDFLLENFHVRPGEIRAKIEIADWLLYAAGELAKINSNRHVLKEINKLRIRVKNGVKEDLLPLLKLKGVGRARARKLVINGLKDLGDLKKMDLTSLSQILGKVVAENVKKQLGEEVKEVPKGKRKGQLSLMKY